MINDLLKAAVDKKASDLYLVANHRPVLRVDGELIEVPKSKILSSKEAKDLIFSILDKEAQERLAKMKDVDTSYSVKGVGRFRVNLHWERGNPAMVARVITEKIPTMKDILMPDIAYQLARLKQGFIIVTGPTGQGKSTTMAAMIDLINEERREHVITLEDPIEFIYKNNKSIIEQRELGVDMNDFGSGLKHVLRQDPDVILVGEMRDLESVALTLTAAETGHLVFTTLHTASAAQTVDRIIDVFPPHQQNQIRMQLSTILAGVISQRLLPKKGGGRIAAREILVSTPAIANLVREQKTHQIDNVIATSSKDGMITMEQDLKRLLKENLIDEEAAYEYLVKKERFTR